MPQTAEKEKIVRTEGVLGGKPRIEGTRVRVIDIVGQYEEAELSPEEIAEQYDLSVEEVYAALVYYYEHPKEIRRELAKQRSAGKQVTA